jgi:hypothetical protein
LLRKIGQNGDLKKISIGGLCRQTKARRLFTPPWVHIFDEEIEGSSLKYRKGGNAAKLPNPGRDPTWVENPAAAA